MFGAGSFWGVQFYFDQIPGVIKTTTGYSGGHTKNPTYEDVCTHTTGHAEVVLVEFNPQEVDYQTLLKQFFRMHDPTQLNRQGPDIGDSYRSAIFYQDDEQKAQAQKLIDQLNASEFKGKIVTTLEKATNFWPAEDYHQKYSARTGIG